MMELLVIVLCCAALWLGYNYKRRPEWVKSKLRKLKERFK